MDLNKGPFGLHRRVHQIQGWHRLCQDVGFPAKHKQVDECPLNTPLDMRDRVRDKVRDKLLDKQLSGKLSGGLSGGLSAHFAEIHAANPRGFRVVLGPEWFRSGFQAVSENCLKTCSGVCPGFLGPQSCPDDVRGYVRLFVPGFWALKAAWRIVRGVCPGSCPADFVPSKQSEARLDSGYESRCVCRTASVK